MVLALVFPKPAVSKNPNEKSSSRFEIASAALPTVRFHRPPARCPSTRSPAASGLARMPIDRRTSPDSVAVTPKAIKWVETTPSRLSHWLPNLGLLWYNVLLVLILSSTAIIAPASLILLPTALGRVPQRLLRRRGSSSPQPARLSPYRRGVNRLFGARLLRPASDASRQPQFLLDFFALLALVPWSICVHACSSRAASTSFLSLVASSRPARRFQSSLRSTTSKRRSRRSSIRRILRSQRTRPISPPD